ncbi:hypothetical protein CMO91_00575 [Candidatus Woesearchaeota archaeon]|jgi:hypothetical protein|nr:hypothetical protein [Candidatus Woesearchaeota archaeon]|tara:strand:+ start:561 stop:1124 length:564 start_codon:yes stop_codon:yes gene_type:complete
MDKGLVAYVKKGKVKHYAAAPPRELSRFVEEKRNSFRNLLPELEMRAAKSTIQEEAEVFEGWKGVRTMQVLHLDPAKKGDEFFFFAADVPPKNKEIQAFFEKYDTVRKKKGVIAKGIAPERMRPLFKHRSYLTMKYVDHPVPPGLGMCANGLTLISFEDRPVGYLLRSKQLYDIFRNYFHSVWERTK